VVLGLALVAGAAVFALLPVGAPLSTSEAECNPLSIEQAYANQTPSTTVSGSGTSYVPAILVWLDPASAIPSGDPNAAQSKALCQSAAQSQLTPGFVLGGVGIALLIFGPIVLTYVVAGRRTVSPGRGWINPPPGWYDDPSHVDVGTQRWWDGERWTGQSRHRIE
jgi:hypothetical protein